MGVPTPAVGDRPFKIEKTIPSEKEEPKSYLNEQRLKEHVSETQLILIHDRNETSNATQSFRKTRNGSLGLPLPIQDRTPLHQKQKNWTHSLLSIENAI